MASSSRVPQLAGLASDTFGRLDDILSHYQAHPRVSEIGSVIAVGSGVARVKGLTRISADEVVEFPGGLLGLATSVTTEEVGIVLLGAYHKLRAGDPAVATQRVADVPVGSGLLGRVVDAAGRALDEGGAVSASERAPIERPAPAIIERAPVSEPLQTGIKAIDTALPIGRGQRELILGDRQTGKTTIALDAILNQCDTGVISVYCAIGQRGSAVARVIATLRNHGALERCVVVVAAGEDAPGLQFTAPYAATTIAEYFMKNGQDVLIVYDDLTHHARAYRELSLLLRRPPGREAYPGDIFYIHSRMLERATQLRAGQGGGSLTALPIVETQAQDIAAYIPTNLISITDGQIYLSPELQRKGQLPAVDIGRSVSRVGAKAQRPALRGVAGDLRLAYAQFEELETFARFGTRLDPETRLRLERGRRAREVLKQDEHDMFTVAEQIISVLAMTEGLLDDVPVEAIAAAEARLRVCAREEAAGIASELAAGKILDAETRSDLLRIIRAALSGAAKRATHGDP